MGIPEFTNIFSKRQVVPMDKEVARARLHEIWYQFKAKEISAEQTRDEAMKIIVASGMTLEDMARIVVETKGWTPEATRILTQN
jgi:predicted CoA-binding protein